MWFDGGRIFLLLFITWSDCNFDRDEDKDGNKDDSSSWTLFIWAIRSKTWLLSNKDTEILVFNLGGTFSEYARIKAE